MTLNKEIWTKQDYQEFIQYLKENADSTYKDFHQSLVPNIEEFLGCRVPFNVLFNDYIISNLCLFTK